MKMLVKVALTGTDAKDPASRQLAYNRLREIVCQNLELLGVWGEERINQLDRLEREILFAESSMALATAPSACTGGDDMGKWYAHDAQETTSPSDYEPDTNDARDCDDVSESANEAESSTRHSKHSNVRERAENRAKIIQSLVKSIDKQIGADPERRFVIYETLRARLIYKEETAKAKTIFNSAELEASIATIESRHFSTDNFATNQTDDLPEQQSPSPECSTARLKPDDNRKEEAGELVSEIRVEHDELLEFLETNANDDSEAEKHTGQSGGRHFEDSPLNAFSEMYEDFGAPQDPERDDSVPAGRPNLALRFYSHAKTPALLKTVIAVALVTTSLWIGITQLSDFVSAETPHPRSSVSTAVVGRPMTVDGRYGTREPVLTAAPPSTEHSTRNAVNNASLSTGRAYSRPQAALWAGYASAYFAMNGDNGQPVRSDEMEWSVVSLPSAYAHGFNPALYGHATIAKLGLQVAVIVRLNHDDALNASHVIDIIFAGSGLDAAGGVQELLGIVLQNDADGTREALKGAAFHVDLNAFSLTLQDTQAARSFNVELLRQAGIMDVAVILGNGRQAGIRLVLGLEGKRELLTALNYWSKKSDKVARLSVETRSTEPVAPSSSIEEPVSARVMWPIGPSIRDDLRGPIPVPAQKPNQAVAVAVAQ